MVIPPRNCGSRFSTNAATPSAASSDFEHFAIGRHWVSCAFCGTPAASGTHSIVPLHFFDALHRQAAPTTRSRRPIHSAPPPSAPLSAPPCSPTRNAPPQRPLIRRPSKQHLHRDVMRNTARQALQCTRIGHNAQRHFRQAKLNMIRGD